MHKLFELESVVEQEIDSVIQQGCVKPDQWDSLGKAVDIMKDISTIRAMEDGEYEKGEYSRDSYPYVHIPRHPYSRDGYMRGNSYDQDRIDSRGSRDGWNEPTGHSMDGDVDSAIIVLEKRLDKTRDPKARESIMATIDSLKKGR